MTLREEIVRAGFATLTHHEKRIFAWHYGWDIMEKNGRFHAYKNDETSDYSAGDSDTLWKSTGLTSHVLEDAFDLKNN